jgi:lysophospholipase L1-like esterase
MSAQSVPGIGRTVGTVLAYAGGALSAASALTMGVLIGQVAIARLTIPGAEAPPPRCGGDYGDEFAGAPVLRLAVLGDSTAAGYGVLTRDETPGALLATWIAAAVRRPVRLVCPAVVGSPSSWLAPQVETVLETRVDLAIVLVGANDITMRVSDAVAVGHLADAVRDLRGSGAQVVVAACPDLSTIRPILPPLRWLAGHWSRRLAAVQTKTALELGAWTVALGELLGPQFAAAPDRMFGLDRYHPSAEGYKAAAAAILPAALGALGFGFERHGLHDGATDGTTAGYDMAVSP